MASQFEVAHTAAAIYAESLLQLANEAGQAEEIGAELMDLAALWKTDPSFAALMSAVTIDVAARRETIRKAFGGRVRQLTLNLLLVLNDKRRSMILPAVCDAYRRKLDRQSGREQVQVVSAVQIDDAQRGKIREQVKRLTGREADIVERLDPESLGGLTVQVGDKLFDLSLRNRLRGLRRNLLGSVEKHLLAGTGRFVGGTNG